MATVIYQKHRKSAVRSVDRFNSMSAIWWHEPSTKLQLRFESEFGDSTAVQLDAEEVQQLKSFIEFSESRT